VPTREPGSPGEGLDVEAPEFLDSVAQKRAQSCSIFFATSLPRHPTFRRFQEHGLTSGKAKHTPQTD
jgi:hypothetical protein